MGSAPQSRKVRNRSDLSRSIVFARTAGFGASRPLPSVPTKVRLLNRLPTLDLGGGNSLLAPLRTLVCVDSKVGRLPPYLPFATSLGTGSIGR